MNTSTNINYTREKVLWTALVPQIILLTISILWIYISPRDNVSKYLVFSFKALAIGIITGLGLAVFGYIFYKWSQKTKRFSEIIELFEKVLAPIFKNLKVFDIIFLSCVSGFCEEIFFRGLLLPKIGIVLASIAFGLLHLPGFKYWIYALWATLSGALFGYLFILFNSLWLPIIAHIVNNIIGMLLLTRLKR